MAKQTRRDTSSATSSTKRSSSLMSMEEALAALIQRNEELITLNKSKDEFIALTSHQLRTPATGVKQYLGLLLEGYADPLTPDQMTFVKKAYENNERQLHIVDDILRVAQLDLDKIKLDFDIYDISLIVEVAIESLQGKFRRKKQIVQYSAPPQPVLSRVDSEEFRLVIENILENANNYSPGGKKINVKVANTAKGGAKITIQDHGVGISRQDLSKLFQKFSRINNPMSSAIGGTGLGLYFSKKIIELHGGKIRVRSTPGKGTTFTIVLPEQKEAIGNNQA